MFTSKLKIQFHNCDPAGILFYANIFVYAHNAYQQFIEEGVSRNYFQDDEIALPIINSQAEYHKPMKSGELYTVRLMVSQLRDSSFELTYLFYDQNSNVHAEVKTVHVAVSKSDFQKIHLPQDLVDLLRANYV